MKKLVLLDSYFLKEHLNFVLIEFHLTFLQASEIFSQSDSFDSLSVCLIISLILFRFAFSLYPLILFYFSVCHDASLTLTINPNSNFAPHFVPYLLLSFESCFRVSSVHVCMSLS